MSSEKGLRAWRTSPGPCMLSDPYRVARSRSSIPLLASSAVAGGRLVCLCVCVFPLCLLRMSPLAEFSLSSLADSAPTPASTSKMRRFVFNDTGMV